MWLTVLGEGLVAAVRQPLLGLALYLASLVAAALATAMARLVAGSYPWAAGLLDGEWLNLLVEVAAAAAARGRFAEAVLPILLLVLVGGLALLTQALLYALVAGGVLERLRDAGGPRRSFWRGCRRWFWPFVRLGLLGTLPFAILALVGLSLPVPLGAAAVLFGGVAGLALVSGWLELARAGMVARGESGAARALGCAARLALRPRRLPHVVVAWLVLAALSAALSAAQLSSSLEPAAGPVVAQAASFAGAWFKVARLATALAIHRHLECPPGPS